MLLVAFVSRELTQLQSHSYEVIVVGLGIWGSSCLYHLSRRGHRVLGIDRFAPPHEMGSSHGVVRITLPGLPLVAANRPLTLLAAETGTAWLDAEKDVGTQLLVCTGGVVIGAPDSRVIMGALKSHDGLSVPFEILGPDEAMRRFPVFRLLPGEVAVWDAYTSVGFVDRAVKAFIESAVRSGSGARTNETVLAWSADRDGVRVVTVEGTYRADRLVLAAGAWVGDLLGAGIKFTAERQVMAWFRILTNPEDFGPQRCPAFTLEADLQRDSLYGSPSVDGSTVRLAFHLGGRLSEADAVDRIVSEEDLAPMTEIAKARLPGLSEAPTRVSTCFYPHSPDRLWCLGPHPRHPQVFLASGGGGFGFRFGALVGRLVAESIEERPSYDLSAFDPARFHLVDSDS